MATSANPKIFIPSCTDPTLLDHKALTRICPLLNRFLGHLGKLSVVVVTDQPSALTLDCESSEIDSTLQKVHRLCIERVTNRILYVEEPFVKTGSFVASSVIKHQVLFFHVHDKKLYVSYQPGCYKDTHVNHAIDCLKPPNEF